MTNELIGWILISPFVWWIATAIHYSFMVPEDIRTFESSAMAGLFVLSLWWGIYFVK